MKSAKPSEEANKVDGGGRRPGSSFGKPPSLCFPLGGQIVEATLQTIRVARHQAGRPRQKLEQLIGDRGYDSDPLRNQLAGRGIEFIALHRKNEHAPPTQNGLALRRYKRRWIVERTFAWFGSFRRVVWHRDCRLPFSSLLSYRLLHDRFTESFELAWLC